MISLQTISDFQSMALNTKFRSFFDTDQKIGYEELKHEVRMVSRDLFLRPQDVKEIWGINPTENSRFELGLDNYQVRVRSYIWREHNAGRSIQEIANLTNMGYYRVIKHLRSSGISIPVKKKGRRENSPDHNYVSDEERAFILEGHSCQEIGDKFGYTRSMAHQKIINSGLQKDWKSTRASILNRSHLFPVLELLTTRKKELEKKLNDLEIRALREAENSASMNSTLPLKDLYSIFKNYFELEEKGEVIFKELERRTGKGYNTCEGILRRAGYEVRSRHLQLPIEKIRILVESSLSGLDIRALFNYCSPVTLYKLRNGKKCRSLARIGSAKKKEQWHLTYARASQIYEAVDAGFTIPEILELTGYSEKLIDLAIEKRTKISKPLIDVLRKFYDKPDHDKPYKTRELTDRLD